MRLSVEVGALISDQIVNSDEHAVSGGNNRLVRCSFSCIPISQFTFELPLNPGAAYSMKTEMQVGTSFQNQLPHKAAQVGGLNGSFSS